MPGPHDINNMAVFCDFENLALGVQDAKYEPFDIRKVLERLLLKGNIVVKKAYCDWERYKDFKKTMHEAAFELIEIPHTRQVGKNSADIRMVVDALDLCYTKEHVDAFVVLSGDSDFSPLVAKLRENNKVVIGVGVKVATSDLLANSCDEFIYYDDLVRAEQKRRAQAAKKAAEKGAARETAANDASDGQKTKAGKEAAKEREREGKGAGGAEAKEGAGKAAPKKPKSEEQKRQEGLDFLVETVEALIEERGSDDKIWLSMIKPTMQRRQPGFNESYYGFRSVKEMLAAAEKAGLLSMSKDEKNQVLIRLPGAG
jgi:uncharacterized protein (TIGR00288 family)